MSKLQEGAMEKDWIEWEESGLRDELDQAGPFISTNRLSEILSRAARANSTPLYHYSAGVLQQEPHSNKGKTMANDINEDRTRGSRGVLQSRKC